MPINFDEYYKVEMLALRIIRAHPDRKHDKFWFMECVLIYGVFTLYAYFLTNCIINYDLKENNLLEAIRNGVPVSIYLCVSLDFLVLAKEKKTVAKLIKCMKTDYAAAREMDIRRQGVIFYYASLGLRVSKQWFVITFSCVIVFCIKSIILTVYYASKGEFRLVPFHEMHYPHFIESRSDNVFVFIMRYMGEMYYTSLSSLIYLGFIPLGPIFIVHACAQLELIKIKFENIFKEDQVEEKLKDIVKHLQYVNSFVGDINKCFAALYEVTLRGATIIIPLTIYAVLKSAANGYITVEFLSIVLGSQLIIITVCYYSDLLIEKGEEVRQATYACGWERVYLPRARKTLLIIMTRALRPNAIKSIFSIVCLDTLANVYRQAYTAFNLMNTLWD